MLGSLAGTGIVTFATVGVLVFVMMFMKFKADLQFNTVLKTVVKTRIIRPIKVYYESTEYAKRRKKPPKIVKKTIVIRTTDVGLNLHYNKRASVGITLRIKEDSGIPQVLRVLPGSTAYALGIKPLWEVLEINGIKKRYTNWRQAVDDLM